MSATLATAAGHMTDEHMPGSELVAARAPLRRPDHQCAVSAANQIAYGGHGDRVGSADRLARHVC